MFPLNLDDDEKSNINVRIPKSIREKVKKIAEDESKNRKRNISESEIYRRIISDFFSQNRL